MMEYLYLICLLCLTISVPILIRGCFNIHKELPNQGGGISERIDKVAELLDEMADYLNNFGAALDSNPVVPQQHANPLMGILASLLDRNSSNSGHGTTQQEEWEILPPNDPETKQTENELDEPSS
jgi:hypothetical protein